jgi:hypothetical protein
LFQLARIDIGTLLLQTRGNKDLKSSVHLRILVLIKEDALVIVRNFRKVFKFSYSLSKRVDVYRMGITFSNVSNSTSQYASFWLIQCFFWKFLSFVKPFKVLIFKKYYFTEMTVEFLLLNYLNLMMPWLTSISKRYYFVLELWLCQVLFLKLWSFD